MDLDSLICVLFVAGLLMVPVCLIGVVLTCVLTMV